jgi:hypothetical protein
MQKMSEFTAGSNVMRELKPGSPAVCGHGNREFSFLARRGKNTNKVMIVFLAGGICWDAETCSALGDKRTISMDSKQSSRNPDDSPAIPFEIKQALGKDGLAFRLGMFDSTSEVRDNAFAEWSLIAIPDCTGDSHLGNRSYTYDTGNTSCLTVHHKGGVNTGLAMDWFFESFSDLEQVLVIGTTLHEASKASGAEGAAFWGKYIQDRAPSAKVRVVVDSSMALFGPKWREVMRDDPWGTANLEKPPAKETNSDGGIVANKANSGLVLPPRSEWAIGHDDMLAYYEWAAEKSPQLAFAELSSIDDHIQLAQFEMLGGKQKECCTDGCICADGDSGSLQYNKVPNVNEGLHANPSPSSHPPAPSIESLDARLGLGLGGSLDWTKTRKIAVLRRHRKLPHNYRAMLFAGNQRAFLAQNRVYRQSCPRFLHGQSACPEEYVVRHWIQAFAHRYVLLSRARSLSPAHPHKH